eukprot:8814111-Karenia_brevis.AAC.1
MSPTAEGTAQPTEEPWEEDRTLYPDRMLRWPESIVCRGCNNKTFETTFCRWSGCIEQFKSANLVWRINEIQLERMRASSKAGKGRQ